MNIIVRGARQHNLKNIDVEIPHNKLVVITGLSGSGKSSLAFDTIYAEGQRRYVESLSAYARQFLELMDKPEVDFIDGLSPAIAIEQRTPSHNPRSTVGTVTEIYDYLRLLFARIGVPYCPNCGREIRTQTVQQIIDSLKSLPTNTKLIIFAPVVSGRKGEYRELFTRLRQQGFVRVRVDGKIYGIEEEIKLDKYVKHTIDVVVDRLNVNPELYERIADSVETALKTAQGIISVQIMAVPEQPPDELVYSVHHSCINCGVSLPEISPRLFSFNSPYGACPECTGLGTKIEVDPDLVIPDKNLSVNDGCIIPWSNPITNKRNRWKSSWSGYYYDLISAAAERNNVSLDTPFIKLTAEKQNVLLYGDTEFEGVINNLTRRYKETESEYVKEEIYRKYMRTRICPTCQGLRLKKESLAIKVNDLSITDITAMSIETALNFFTDLKLTDKERIIAKQVLKEITNRLSFLRNVGLDYITIDRASMTLAGGESERIHLATQIGSGLVGVLYVLDEPTIGLHQRDNQRLINTLLKLRDLGNTVLVVEHDEETIRNADWIIDLGPGAGVHGGKVIVTGTVNDLINSPESLTGKYLSGNLQIIVPKQRRKPPNKYIEIYGAQQFNLKNINVKIPLGLFVCITGVSGSGKSTLVYEILYKSMAARLWSAKEVPGKHRKIVGLEQINKTIIVDQSPIGRTPRSNPATYTGLFTPIRELFAQLPEAKRRGYKPGRFSFNVKDGRCEACEGDGMLRIEMQFLPAVYVKCDVCHGRRYNEETLQVKFKGKNIYEILDLSVEESLLLFENIPVIKNVLQTLNDVGLGYVKLGQSATTLSGGEAQRVKLASELCRRATGKTIYILDEPTTGLHFADVHKLLEVLHRLVDYGNTVLVIEHNLDVIKSADWIIDLGPEGGDKGGELVVAGTPEQVSEHPVSYTGKFLNKILKL